MRPLKLCRLISAVVLLLNVLPSNSLAQMRNTSASDQYQHVFAVVPLIGKGTGDDPKRLMFVPAEGIQPAVRQAGAPLPPRSGIISYHMQISDDGAYALVEFVGISKADFKDILATTDSRVQLFQKGVQGKDQIEAAFKVYKKDFSLDAFLGVRAPQ